MPPPWSTSTRWRLDCSAPMDVQQAKSAVCDEPVSLHDLRRRDAISHEEVRGTSPTRRPARGHPGASEGGLALAPRILDSRAALRRERDRARARRAARSAAARPRTTRHEGRRAPARVPAPRCVEGEIRASMRPRCTNSREAPPRRRPRHRPPLWRFAARPGAASRARLSGFAAARTARSPRGAPVR